MSIAKDDQRLDSELHCVLCDHNVELEGKDNRNSLEFKCRFGYVVQGKDLVGQHGCDEESRSSYTSCLSWVV